MTARIDEGATEKLKDKEFRETIRKEVRGAVRQGLWRSKIRGCCGCALLALLVFLTLLGLLAYALAETGLVRVPLFSRFYHEPRPARSVEPAATTLPATLQTQFRRQLESRTITFTISEEVLTRTIRDLAATQTSLTFSGAQVAVLPDGLHLFARFELRGSRGTMRVRLVPELRNNTPTFRIRKVELGELPLWHRPFDILARRALATKLEEALRGFSSFMTLTGMSIEPGAVKITGELISND